MRGRYTYPKHLTGEWDFKSNASPKINMNPKVKEHIKSALITFVTAFAIAVVPHIDTITLETAKGGALVGLLFAGVRAGIKAFLQLLATYQK